MPTHREIRHCRPRIACALACAFVPVLAGCVDLLGDYHTSGCAQADCSTWAQRFGDAEEQAAAGVAIAGNDDILVLSNAAGAIDFGGGSADSAGLNDIFVTRFDPGGAHLWTAHFRGAGDDYGNAIAVDRSGNALVAGSFEGTVDFGGKELTSAGGKDVFVAKLSPEGDVLWAQMYGDLYNQTAVGVAADGSGNVLVTGCVAGTMAVGNTVLASPTSDDVFVMKLGPDGTPRWALSTGDATSSDCGFRVAADASSNVLVAGDFTGSVTFDQMLVTAGAADIFLAKLTPDGLPLWSRRFGGVGNEIAGGLAVASGGRVTLAGAFEYTVDFGGKQPLTAKAGLDPFVLAVDSSGNTQWSRGLGGGEQELLTGAALDRHGDLLVSGYSGPNGDNLDAYAAKVGQKGEVLWSHIWETSGSQEATGVAVDSKDETVLVGRFSKTLQIGGQTLESEGANDVFLTKLGSDDIAPE